MFKAIWVAGMPRAGSMWTFNIVRALVRRAGYRVLPEEIFITDAETLDYANQQIAVNRDPNTVLVLKIHMCLAALPPGHFVITNLRDVRDAMMSYMRFMRVDFDKAFETAKVMVDTTEHYLGFPEDQRMALRYEDVTSAPAAAVAHIAGRIGLRLSDEAADEIAARFSKAKVKDMIEEKTRSVSEALAKKQASCVNNLISKGQGGTAIIDRVTGFQSDHVSDYRDGAWRDLLAEQQILTVNEAFGDWLARHGYAA